MDKETLGKRIRSTRLIRGLTMDELIGQMGISISKNAISRYEKGEMVPRIEVLSEIAEVLGQPLGYFLKPLNLEVKDVRFRTKGALSKKVLDGISERAVELMERYLEAEKLLLLHKEFTHPMPGYTLSSVEQAEEAATRWREAWQLGDQGLHNIYGLLEQHQIKVAELDDVDDAFDGLAIMINGNIPIIVVNSNMTIERRRFTTLHELAHLLFAFDEALSLDEQEKACHRFAGAALMPCALLRQLLGQQRESIYLNELIEIKELYGISLQALMYRTVECGLVSYRRHLEFKKWIETNKKEKGLGAYTGKEETRRFELMVMKALDGEKITLSKAAELLNMQVKDLKKLVENRF